MKKPAYFLVFALLLGCQPQPADLASLVQPIGKDALQTEKDRISYGIGLNFGKRLKADEVEIDPLKFFKGMQDGASAAPGAALMSDEEVAATMATLQQQLATRMAAKQKAATEKALAANQQYLEANKAREGVVTTASGLQYRVLKAGTGPIPTGDDQVVCHYTGKFTDGTVFDSSVQRGEPVTLPVSGILPGWTEALTQMKTGSTWEIVLPSDLAYGEQGAPPVIPANAVLVFEVELLDIVRATPLPAAKPKK